MCYDFMVTFHAGMVKSVDTRDLKSLAVKSVPVRVRLPAPTKKRGLQASLFLLVKVRTRTHFNADAQQASAATSSKTGGYLNLLESGCQRTAIHVKEQIPKAGYLLFYIFPSGVEAPKVPSCKGSCHFACYMQND